MQNVRYNDELVAVATHDGGVLLGHLAEQDKGHPDRRFVTCMLRYANASLQGRLQEPYTDDSAERYARTQLMPDAAFDQRHLDRDHELADHFGVPVDQILMKRDDMVRSWDRPTVLPAARGA